MKSLLYRSVARADLGSDDIFEIVRHSSENNGARGLSGFLIYQQGQFLQLLEGEASQIDDLLAKVRCDPRHHSFEVLCEGSIERKSFPNWRMHRVIAPDSNAMIDRIAEAQEHPLPSEVLSAAVEFFETNQRTRDNQAA